MIGFELCACLDAASLLMFIAYGIIVVWQATLLRFTCIRCGGCYPRRFVLGSKVAASPIWRVFRCHELFMAFFLQAPSTAWNLGNLTRKTTGQGAITWSFYKDIAWFLGSLPINNMNLVEETRSGGDTSIEMIIHTMEIGTTDEEDVLLSGATETELPSAPTEESCNSPAPQRSQGLNFSFFYLGASWPGSAHDSRIFDNSRARVHYEEGTVPGILLGDKGYPCRSYLMTPFRDKVTKGSPQHR
ncbi:hypothetical protein HPB50_016100 [Hyalomma asiaticum]|uniref:Uncharacterized protein n=1 Tax=Hyalomma asiaticum TaxID=266040 RepID=A0ACB7SNY6_HYAAI|nr:hypothetical protein HPB50_016100 [Hyalomma asiaticum]